MSKSPDAFRTISEVADWLDTPAHVLRFWESKFSQVKPIKRAGGRRYYRPADMQLLGGIKRLLHHDGLTIKDVQLLLREKGAKHVGALSSFDMNDDDTVTVESSDQIEVDATPEDEPVFTSIAPRSEAKPIPADDEEDDDSNQMSFPGFEFASDRTKTFERAKPTEPTNKATQSIDIAHIPRVNVEQISTKSTGLLASISKLTTKDLKEQTAQVKAIRSELSTIVAARLSASNS